MAHTVWKQEGREGERERGRDRERVAHTVQLCAIRGKEGEREREEGEV